MVDEIRTLAVCGSMKPAIGLGTPSAARELLKLAVNGINRIRPMIETIDLREEKLPFFDGRDPVSHENSSVARCRARVESATTYIFSVPAYWGGVSGAFKNFIDIVSGPNYGGGGVSPFTGKSCAILIVGADPHTAETAKSHMVHICGTLGLIRIGTPVVIGNPRDQEDVARKLVLMRSEIAQLLINSSQNIRDIDQ